MITASANGHLTTAVLLQCVNDINKKIRPATVTKIIVSGNDKLNLVTRETAGQILLHVYSGHGHLTTSDLLLQREAGANGHLNTAEVQ